MVEDSPLRNSLVSIGDTIQSRGGELLQGVLTSAAGVVNILVFLVVVPVVAFYLLLDWDRMVARIDDLLPRDHAPIIRDLARTDRPDAGQFRARAGHGLPDPRHVLRRGADGDRVAIRPGRGLVAGLLTFIPYVGALVGGPCPSAWRCSSSGGNGGRSSPWRWCSRRASWSRATS
jgi:hypothetical protein